MLPVLLTMILSLAQSTGELHVGDAVLVSAGRQSVPHVEPYLVAHPSDPRALVGASVTLASDRLRETGSRLSVGRFHFRRRRGNLAEPGAATVLDRSLAGVRARR